MTYIPKQKEMAKFLAKYKNIVITADGISYALAKEASLKLKKHPTLMYTQAF